MMITDDSAQELRADRLEKELLSVRHDLAALADLMDAEAFRPLSEPQPGDRIRQVLAGTWTP